MNDNDTPCAEKDCKNMSAISYLLKVKGFLQKMNVELCEQSSERLGKEELKLNNGGKVAAFEEYIKS